MSRSPGKTKISRDCATSSGICPHWLQLSYFPLRSPSLINYFLVVFPLPFLINSPCVPHHYNFLCHSLSLHYFFFFSVLRWCQVVCDNLRPMGIKEVTREKKKASGADSWKKKACFSGLVDGVPNTTLHGSTVIFKAFLPQPLLTPLLPCFH